MLLLLDCQFVYSFRLRLLHMHVHLFIYDFSLSKLRLPLLLLAISGRLGAKLLLVSLSSRLFCVPIRPLFLATASNFNYLFSFLFGLPDLFSSLLFFQAEQANSIREQY